MTRLSFHKHTPLSAGKRFYTLWVALCLLVASVFSGPVRALAANLKITPRLSILEEYTSNFFLTPDKEEQDYTTIVSPGLTASFNVRKGNIELAYDPSYNVYSDHQIYNRWFHQVQANGRYGLTRYTALHLSDGFVYTSEPTTVQTASTTENTTAQPIRRPIFDSSGSASAAVTTTPAAGQPGSSDIAIRAGSRRVYFTNAADIGLVHQMGPDDSIALHYTHTLLQNDDPSIEDNQSHRPSLVLNYWFVPGRWKIETLTALTDAIYKGDQDDFQNWEAEMTLLRRFNRHLDGFLWYSHSYMVFDGTTDDYQIYKPLLGVRYTAGEDTRIEASFGYWFQDYQQDDDKSGFLVDSLIRQTWRFRQATFQLSGTSGYELSYLDAANSGFQLYYGVDGNLQYRFTRKLQGEIFSAYRLENYPNYQDTAGDRRDHSIESGLQISYRILTWLDTQLRYSFNTLKSTQHEDDYTDHRILIGLVIAPQAPYRLSF